MSEEWRICPRYPHLRVSRDGRIETRQRRGRPPIVAGEYNWGRWRPLKPFVNGYGYATVSIKNDRKAKTHKVENVHRLVALTWLGDEPFPGAFVRHLDDNPVNNHADNLAWGTVRDNRDDAYRNGKIKLSEERKNSKLTEAERQFVKWAAASGLFTQAEIAGHLNVTSAAVNHIVKGRSDRARRTHAQ